MARIGFIGLGNMGLPMAQNLLRAGHAVAGFDLNAETSERLTASGGTRANSAAEVCRDAEIVITVDSIAGCELRRRGRADPKSPPARQTPRPATRRR